MTSSDVGVAFNILFLTNNPGHGTIAVTHAVDKTRHYQRINESKFIVRNNQPIKLKVALCLVCSNQIISKCKTMGTLLQVMSATLECCRSAQVKKVLYV